jgi:hypothetical protein
MSTTQTALTHKRAASSIKLDSRLANGPSVVSLFVKNVRLLNLDLLPDWPVLTPASLSNQDARVRIRGTEWCLYQLFKVYDAATTADKLQPFFPPLEPLQSINLRAALYRCLNELKKNGVLARDAVLRKSMLDECQGDKFWELCLNFSSIVLHKVRVEHKNNARSKPVAERIGATQRLSKSHRESMLPLSVAHRAALTKVLQEKDRKRETFSRLYNVLVEKDADLQQRMANVSRKAQDRLLPDSPSTAVRANKLKVAQDVLDNQWVGSNELQAALVYGKPVSGADGSSSTAGGDFILTSQFDDLWEANKNDQLGSLAATEATLLEDLDARARQQRRRLQRWQNFHDKLLKQAQALIETTASASASASGTSDGARTSAAAPVQTPAPKRDTPLCFDRHQNLSIHDLEDLPQSPADRPMRDRTVVLTKYDDLLTAMREELRRNATPGQQPVAPPSRETLRDSRRISLRPVPHQNSLDMAMSMSPSPTEGHRRSPSQTAVPMRAHLTRRVSSRSRSYAQPKVISQRELVPLKSELFSPLKGGKRMSMAGPSPLGSSEQDSSSALGSYQYPDDSLDAALRRRGRDNSIGNQSASAIAAAAQFPSSRASSNSRSSSPLNNPPSTGSGDLSQQRRRSSLAARIPVVPSGAGMRTTLADRTRMSMAFQPAHSSAHSSSSGDDYENTGSNSHHQRAGSTMDEVHQESPSTAALLDRTRHSIARAPPAPARHHTKTNSQHNHPAHSRSRSTVYPVNQFDSPPPRNRPAHTSSDHDHPEAGGPQTPDDHPEDPSTVEADYASVFRARPKVKLSPVLSPRDSGHAGMMGVGAGLDLSEPIEAVAEED